MKFGGACMVDRWGSGKLVTLFSFECGQFLSTRVLIISDLGGRYYRKDDMVYLDNV